MIVTGVPVIGLERKDLRPTNIENMEREHVIGLERMDFRPTNTQKMERARVRTFVHAELSGGSGNL